MLFGRKRSDPIIEFWDWWPQARPRLTAALAAGDGGAALAPLGDEISRRVKAIHPKLDWELSKGSVAQHDFTVSPAGAAELRAIAARWLALAPAADDTWEFHDARQPTAGFSDAKLMLDGRELALSDVRFSVAAREHSADVAVFHPLFADLPDSARIQIAFLCLDWALGEHAVEVWVGEVKASTTGGPQAYTVDGLRAAIEELAAAHTEPTWAILEGRARDGSVVLATAQMPLRSARWPRFDTHVALRLPFEDRGNGLPTDAALTLLREFEDSLNPMLAGDGELLAHETSKGVRTLHYYVDGRTPLAQNLISAASSWRGGRGASDLDPALGAIAHLDASR
jgi:hypothetical protein